MINPYKIAREDLPLIVLSTDSSGFTSWVIKWRTKSNYSHIMMQIYPGGYHSQGNTFSFASIDRYMTKTGKLKFWKIKNLANFERNRLCNMINKDMRGSWWSKRYDYFGIIGQALGIGKINSPSRNYCSERVAKYLRSILEGIPLHPSPEELNEVFKTHSRLEVFGRWAAD